MKILQRSLSFSTLTTHSTTYQVMCMVYTVLGGMKYTPASKLGYLAPPLGNFLWVPNCSLGTPECKTIFSSKRIWYGYVKMHGFHGNTLYDSQGAQWLSGRVLDSRPRGRGFEPHRRHCVVVLEQDTFILA